MPGGPTAGAPNPFLAGLTGRCPNCGGGSLFSGFLRVRPRCPACGLDLARSDSGDGPVVFIILIVGALACCGALVTEVAVRPPVWVNLLVWLPAAAVLSLALLRPLKGVMIALQLHNKASEPRHGE
jgi:uncharacterized protein (DUF983 family)